MKAEGQGPAKQRRWVFVAFSALIAVIVQAPLIFIPFKARSARGDEARIIEVTIAPAEWWPPTPATNKRPARPNSPPAHASASSAARRALGLQSTEQPRNTIDGLAGASPEEGVGANVSARNPWRVAPKTGALGNDQFDCSNSNGQTIWKRWREFCGSDVEVGDVRAERVYRVGEPLRSIGDHSPHVR